MTFIRVNPPSIIDYASQATDVFRNVRTTLDTLVSEAVNVDYHGENAVEFKTRCGQMAVDFANSLNGDMQQIAQAVSASTSAISGSLGGMAIPLDIPVQPFDMPAVPASDGSVQVQTEGLSALAESASAHFDQISAGFDNHLAALQATDWEGLAKQNAVSAVGTFTGQAQDAISQTRARIATYIEQQVSATLSADAAA